MLLCIREGPLWFMPFFLSDDSSRWLPPAAFLRLGAAQKVQRERGSRRTKISVMMTPLSVRLG